LAKVALEAETIRIPISRPYPAHVRPNPQSAAKARHNGLGYVGDGWSRLWGWLLASLIATAVQAHPHVWVSASLVLQVHDKCITALQLTYTFDPAYSSLLISDFDKDKNGQLNPTELSELAAALQTALKEIDFFVHLTVDQQNIEVKTVSDVQVSILREEVRLTFTLSLPKPVDLKTSQFDFALYDPSNYVAVIYDDRQEAVRIDGTLPSACSFKVLPVTLPNMSIGALLAKDIRIVCQ
jgi:tRNA threonylcarbamoyladenosine biosynthesis protein TsaE